MIEEYRKSDIRSKRIIRAILAFCVGILLILLLIKVFSVIKKSSILPIKQVEIYGTQYIDKSEIVKRMNLDTDRSILFFNSRSARLSLLQDGRISGIELVKVYPDTLKIYVAEKDKKYLLFTGSVLYWLSKDGTVLIESNEERDTTIPLITMNSNNDDIKIGEQIPNFMVRGIISSLAEIEKVYPQFYKRLYSFSVNEKGVYVRLKDGKYRVYLGNEINKEKFEKLRALLIVLESKGDDVIALDEIIEIDMSFSHAAVRRGEFNDELL